MLPAFSDDPRKTVFDGNSAHDVGQLSGNKWCRKESQPCKRKEQNHKSIQASNKRACRQRNTSYFGTYWMELQLWVPWEQQVVSCCSLQCVHRENKPPIVQKKSCIEPKDHPWETVKLAVAFKHRLKQKNSSESKSARKNPVMALATYRQCFRCGANGITLEHLKVWRTK